MGIKKNVKNANDGLKRWTHEARKKEKQKNYCATLEKPSTPKLFQTFVSK